MRLPPKKSLLLALTVLFGLTASNATGAVIFNGDFSSATDLDGYTVTGNGVTEPTGDFAQLASNGDLLRTLEQTFAIPTGSSSLSFDFAFSTDTTTSGGLFVDSTAVSITTPDGDFLDILVVDLFGVVPDPSEGSESFTGATPIDVSFDNSVSIAGFTPFSGGTTFSGRITLDLPSNVLGDQATIFLDLFDESDGASSRAAFDNLSVTSSAAPPSTVPEPTSVIVWSLGALVGAAGTARRRGRAATA